METFIIVMMILYFVLLMVNTMNQVEASKFNIKIAQKKVEWLKEINNTLEELKK